MQRLLLFALLCATVSAFSVPAWVPLVSTSNEPALQRVSRGLLDLQVRLHRYPARTISLLDVVAPDMHQQFVLKRTFLAEIDRVWRQTLQQLIADGSETAATEDLPLAALVDTLRAGKAIEDAPVAAYLAGQASDSQERITHRRLHSMLWADVLLRRRLSAADAATGLTNTLLLQRKEVSTEVLVRYQMNALLHADSPEQARANRCLAPYASIGTRSKALDLEHCVMQPARARLQRRDVGTTVQSALGSIMSIDVVDWLKRELGVMDIFVVGLGFALNGVTSDTTIRVLAAAMLAAHFAYSKLRHVMHFRTVDSMPYWVAIANETQPVSEGVALYEQEHAVTGRLAVSAIHCGYGDDAILYSREVTGDVTNLFVRDVCLSFPDAFFRSDATATAMTGHVYDWTKNAYFKQEPALVRDRKAVVTVDVSTPLECETHGRTRDALAISMHFSPNFGLKKQKCNLWFREPGESARVLQPEYHNTVRTQDRRFIARLRKIQ